MSKKKKFAGKKTKLAKHALTQALEQVQSQDTTLPPSPLATKTLAQALQNLRHDQLPLHLPPAEASASSDPLQADAHNHYLAVLKELEDIREFLRAGEVPHRHRRHGPVPATLPAPDIIFYSLQIISHTLREIRGLLA